MKFRLQSRRWAAIIVAVLTVALAFFLVKPVGASDVVTSTAVTQTTNQPNAPNAGSQVTAQPTQPTENSRQTNQSTSTMASDGANTNKSVNAASKSTENSLSVDKEDAENAPAETNEPSQVNPTNSSITITNSATGQPLKNGDTIDQYTPLRVDMTYDFSGTNVKSGDYFDFSVPDQLKITGGTNIETDDGTATITGNSGRFVFSSTGSDAKVALHFTIQIDDQKASGNTDVPITFKINNKDDASWTVHYVPGTVSPQERLSKYTMNDDLSKGNVKYAIRINPNGDVEYKSAVIADHLRTPGFTYDETSFDIREVTWTWNGSNWENTTLANLTDIKPTFSDDDTSFTIDFGDRIIKNDAHQGFLILYSVLYKGKPVNQDENLGDRPADGTTIRNEVTLTSKNQAPIDYPQTLTIKNSSGSSELRRFTLDVLKTDENSQPLKGAVFQLIDNFDNHIVAQATTDDNGKVSFTELSRGNYTIHELTAPAGYQLAADVTVSADEFKDNELTISKKIVDYKLNKLISIPVVKVWNDNNDQYGIRPKSITVKLLKDLKDTGKTIVLSEKSNWQGKFTDLVPGNYTVREEAVDGYTADVAYDAKTSSYTITNTPIKISVPVKKVWNDNNDQYGIRPESITVKLLKDLKETGKTIVLSDKNNWQGTFTDLIPGNYTVREETVDGYWANIAYDAKTGYTITNTPITVTKSVTKQWVDGNDQDGVRPGSIQVQLKRIVDGKTITDAPITLDAIHNWTYTWTELPQYQDGKKVTYTVEELPVIGYDTSYQTDPKSGNVTITNTHIPAKISKTVTKIWNDANNQDGLRPDSITANLYANGQFVDSVVLNAANNWTGTISNLAQNANGQAIDYTWQEANVPDGYTSDVNGDVITNTHTPATIAKTVTKQWVDNDNQDGLRPGSIKVNLLANGQIVKTVTLTADNNWTATIDGLAQKANGQDIAYTWQEANVPAGYESKVAGDVITNTHAPLTTKVTVTKVWNDADNKDGLRPASVTINLLANGQVIRTVELNATNNWHAEFDDLMVYSHQGQRIVYTVEEANVPAGYQSAVSQDGLNFTVTNTHQPTTPDQPANPTPVTPDQPGQPTTPTEPTTPVTPGQPGQPGTPVVPGQPNVPVSSVQPSQPVSQGQPQLPQTGNHDGLALMILGLVLMSMTIYVGKQRD